MQGEEADRGPAAAGRADSSGRVSVKERASDLADRADDSGRRKSQRRKRTPQAFLREVLVLFAVALTIALLIKTYLVQPYFIPSTSMEDTLLVGDKVLVNKLVYHLRPIHRGDIVVFDGAGSWAPAPRAGQPSHNPLARAYDVTFGALFRWTKALFGSAPGQVDYIKRVIGLPGDRVACCDARGQITVNRVPLDEKSYLLPGSQPSIYPFRIVVPPGRLWVLGDDRPVSADSRLHHCGYPDPSTECVSYDRGGTIPEDKVVGRAFMVVWPLSRLRVLRIPATFFQALLRHAATRPPASQTALPPGAPILPFAGGFAVALPLTGLWSMRRRRRRMRLHGSR